jgi:hypothetical protein
MRERCGAGCFRSAAAARGRPLLTVAPGACLALLRPRAAAPPGPPPLLACAAALLLRPLALPGIRCLLVAAPLLLGSIPALGHHHRAQQRPLGWLLPRLPRNLPVLLVSHVLLPGLQREADALRDARAPLGVRLTQLLLIRGELLQLLRLSGGWGVGG